MHIGIVGSGLMGMTLAFLFAESGQKVTVLEQGRAIGGIHQAVRLNECLTLSPYQHSIFPNDTETFGLINRLGLGHELIYHPATSGFIHHGHVFPLTTLRDFLTFSPLTLSQRWQLGQTIMQAWLTRDWYRLDQIPVEAWLVSLGGRSTFERIWAPLLEAKFDYDYAQVPATFIWSWLKRVMGLRRPLTWRASLAQLRHGPAQMIDAMAAAVQARGGNILTQVRVREIEVSSGQMGRVRTHTGLFEFDAVIAAVPTPEFSRLLLSADEAYLNTLNAARYLGLICPILVLDRPLSSFWSLSLTDPSSPFASIIQMPCPDDPHKHLVYLPKYISPGSDWMGVPDSDILDAWLLRLRQIYPALKPEHIQTAVVNRARYVDPLHFLNATERIPAVQTPYSGLYLANTSQVYPDLPNSEAVLVHARRVAQLVLSQPERHRLTLSAA